MLSTARCLALLSGGLLAVAAPALAQTVWTVGTGGFTQIGPAVAAAAAGDVIEVAPGVYDPFTLDKALTIAALPGGPVSIMHVAATPLPTLLLRPPVGTVACLRGIEVHNPWSFTLPFWAVATVVDRGTVCFEDCRFEGWGAWWANGLQVQNASAVLLRCSAIGFGVATSNPGGAFGTGLRCTNAQVEAVDCWFHGSDDSNDSFAGCGVLAQASTLHLVRCLVEGGSDLEFLTNGPATGIYSDGGGRVWLADCTVRGGSAFGNNNPAATGIYNAGPQPIELDRTTITGGTSQPPYGPAPPIVGPAVVAQLLGLGAVTQPLNLGQPYTIAYRTQPGWPVAVLAATDLASTAVPLVVEPVLLPVGGAWTTAFLIADGNGDAVYTRTMPGNAALRHARLFLQAFTGLSIPLRTAPPLGYLAR
jgi:hypothetical protein